MTDSSPKQSPTLSPQVWFILGPSGVGKTCFSQYVAERRKWLHMEIDQFPNGDGIDMYGLREEWNLFYAEKEGRPLIEKLKSHFLSQGYSGMVVSFPGVLMLLPEHAHAIKKHVKIAYLFGPKQYCKEAFLKRESLSGRRLGADHWDRNNDETYAKMAQPDFNRFRVDVFAGDGKRRVESEIYDEIIKRAY